MSTELLLLFSLFLNSIGCKAYNAFQWIWFFQSQVPEPDITMVFVLELVFPACFIIASKQIILILVILINVQH